MTRFLILLIAVCAFLGSYAITASAQDVIAVDIKISPNTICLESDGTWVSVHTDIALSRVDTSTITLNAIPVAWTKADARGHLVAKFAQGDIKAIVAPPEATLELLGMTNDGVQFQGSDTAFVK